jgi:hypothetical protein
VGKPGRKRPVGRPIRRLEYNINTDLVEIGWCGLYWMVVAQERNKWGGLVNAVINLRII